VPFKWLPDAELDPHPRLTWLTECCFDLTVMALYRKEEILPADYRLDPGTLVVSNHQRDSDVPVLTTVLCRRRGFHIGFPLPFYATREDIFRRGFLRDLLGEAGWPRPLPELLGRVPLLWLFRIVRARPMRRVREFTFGEALAALVAAGSGDAAPAAVLRESTLRRLEATLGRVPRTVRDTARARLGRMRVEEWGLRRLRLEALHRLAADFRAIVSAHLDDFAELLDAGRVVYLAPEGTISETGRMRRIRRGPWALLERARETPPVRPLSLSYDPLGPGRLRVVVKVGETFDAAHIQTMRDCNARLRHELLSLCAVTPSHLVSRYLHRGPAVFSFEAFARWFADAARAVADSPLILDPLLERRDPRDVARERFDWLVRRRLLRRDGTAWRNGRSRGAPPGWRRPDNTVTYLDTAFEELLSLDPRLAASLEP